MAGWDDMPVGSTQVLYVQCFPCSFFLSMRFTFPNGYGHELLSHRLLILALTSSHTSKSQEEWSQTIHTQ